MQSRLLTVLIKRASFLRKDPTNENLKQKRIKFEKMGRWMKPARGTLIKSYNIAGISVDEVINTHDIRKAILYVHGGGFVYGTNKVHLHMLSKLSQYANAKIIAVDYSLSPENKYPVAINEVYGVYFELLKDRTPLYVGGDSAGGNLALCLTLMLRDEGLALPKGVFLMSPSTDGTFSNEWFTLNKDKDIMISRNKLDYFLKAYIPENMNIRDPHISPLFANLRDLPPVLLHVGSNEIMYGDSLLLHGKIKEIGGNSELYVGKDMWHVWHLFSRYIPEARSSLKLIADFINNHD